MGKRENQRRQQVGKRRWIESRWQRRRGVERHSRIGIERERVRSTERVLVCLTCRNQQRIGLDPGYKCSMHSVQTSTERYCNTNMHFIIIRNFELLFIDS